MVAKRFVEKLKMKRDPKGTTTWSSPAGPLSTNKKVTCQFTIPELHDDKLIEWDCHVLDNLSMNYDMIIGRDLLEFAGIDIRFSTQEVEWGEATMPFKPHDATPQDAYHVEDDPSLEDMTDRIKRILDAKYEPANLDEVVDEQADDSSLLLPNFGLQ